MIKIGQYESEICATLYIVQPAIKYFKISELYDI